MSAADAKPLGDTQWETLRDPEGPPQFELDAWVALAPFEKLCGMEILHAADGEATLAMPFTVKLSQGGGILHGGAVTALADTAIAMAIKTLLPAGSHFVTGTLNVRFLAPVHSGTVTAKGRVLGREGRRFQTIAEVYDENATKVAELSAPFTVLREGPS